MINSTGSAVQIIGKKITGVRTHDGTIYVPLKALCAFLGINYNRQRSKISNGSAFLSELVPIQGKGGRKRKMLCLRLEQIGDWAATIDPDTVRPRALEALRDFQEQPEEALEDSETEEDSNMRKETKKQAYNCLGNSSWFLDAFLIWVEEMIKYGAYFPGEDIRKASREKVREFVRRTEATFELCKQQWTLHGTMRSWMTASTKKD